jgi:2-polyprenyl-3-methyl-5-hydroxy-6-metoxy-1,4-benzoquinol methylase
MNNFHKCCPVFGSEKKRDMSGYEAHHLMKCRDCKMVFSAVIPSHQDLVAHYDNYGRNDYLSPITIKRYHELLDQFEPYRQSNRILDVGCGIGYFLQVAKDRGWEVYGTEYTDEAIKICREKGITMKKGDLSESMFSQGFFDVITT